MLLGDPQQLRQPGRGIHPDGADVSALQHVIGADDVLPADRGVFLDRSWRMAPALCGVVSELSYDGQLRPAPTTAGNRIDLPARWAAPRGSAGSRWCTRATGRPPARRPRWWWSWSPTCSAGPGATRAATGWSGRATCWW
ncbi:hypothetical protein ACFQX8_11710 [Klenkia terrae]|uniref:hypothetical protein n=1 Tax=Klenkia terrae TaxID=1052259 RepID=UPI00360DBB79